MNDYYRTAEEIDVLLRNRPARRPHYEITKGNSVGEITMAKVLVVTSGKGGVGKTTSTAALGAALAQMTWVCGISIL
jgi:Mrp family chromosome partitioning ATPase